MVVRDKKSILYVIKRVTACFIIAALFVYAFPSESMADSYSAGGGKALGEASIAIGDNSPKNTTKASGSQSIAIGVNSVAEGSFSTAVGAFAGKYVKAPSKWSTSIGYAAAVDVNYGVALGGKSVADRITTKEGVYVPFLSIGGAVSDANKEMIDKTVKGDWGVVSVGRDENTRQITGVAAGVKDTDAVNVAQLRALSNIVETMNAVDTILALTYEKNSQNRLSLKDAGTGVRISNVADGVDDKDAVNYGQLSAVSGDLSILDARVASQDNNLAALQSSDGLSVKYDKNSQNRLSLKDVGTGVRISNVADGVDDKDAVNYGQLSAVSGDLSILDARVASQDRNLAALQSSDGLSVKYDDQGKNVVTLNKRADGTLGDAVRLTNVADGKVSQDSTDAVTGRQLWSLGDSMAKALGGTFKITPDGKIDGSFVDGKGEKTGSLQNMLKEVSENASNSGNWTLSVNGKEEKIGGGKLAIADGSNLDIRRGTDGTYTFNVSETPEFRSVKVGNINIREEGINMGGNSLTGLSNGGVYRGSTDAVNGDQLWNAYRRISDLDGDIQAVGAHAAAISALHPVPYNPYEPTTISAGIGFYRNEQSIAVGVFHYVRENVLVNAGVSLNTSGRDPMARAGISFAVGAGSKKKRPVLARDMVEMQRVMSAMQEKLEEIQKENAEIQKKNEEIQKENADIHKENEKNKEVIRELKRALVVEEEM